MEREEFKKNRIGWCLAVSLDFISHILHQNLALTFVIG